jgi:hypothetical protein
VQREHRGPPRNVRPVRPQDTILPWPVGGPFARWDVGRDALALLASPGIERTAVPGTPAVADVNPPLAAFLAEHTQI